MAGLQLQEQDVEPLTLQFNALQEGLRVLDERDLHGIAPLPVLPYPAGSAPKPAVHHEFATQSAVPLAYKPITELSHLLRTRQVSSAELTELYLDRICQFDGDLNSYITVTADLARAQAKAADSAIAAGAATGPLTGVPLAHKDEFLTKGVLTTCGSNVLRDFVPSFDATVIERLHNQGAVMLGTLNMTEWASPLTWSFPYGQPRNPWNLEHDAGGSSTGSGSATAAGLCAGSIGEDTGGSIRRPASNNSCVGLRPSLGRVSTFGMFASSWYQDTAGPIARSVGDCALLLNAIAGYDYQDPMSSRLPVPDYTGALTTDLTGMHLAVVKEAIDAPHLDSEIKKLTIDALDVLRSLGATVAEVSIPLMALSGLINGALGSPRSALHWRHLNESPNLYDTGVRRYTVLPALLPAVTYHRALQLRSLLRDQVLATFATFDALVTPGYPQFPPRIADTKADPVSKEQAVEQMRRYGFHTPANFAGTPAISVPMGFSANGLPVGIHIMGDRYDEMTVFTIGHAYEQMTRWHTVRPPFGDIH